MTDIVFTIRAGVSVEQRARVLSKIQAMPDVEVAGPIKRDSRSETLQRIHFVRLREHSEVTSCLSAIRELPEVESANLPARRGL